MTEEKKQLGRILLQRKLISQEELDRRSRAAARRRTACRSPRAHGERRRLRDGRAPRALRAVRRARHRSEPDRDPARAPRLVPREIAEAHASCPSSCATIASSSRWRTRTTSRSSTSSSSSPAGASTRTSRSPSRSSATIRDAYDAKEHGETTTWARSAAGDARAPRRGAGEVADGAAPRATGAARRAAAAVAPGVRRSSSTSRSRRVAAEADISHERLRHARRGGLAGRRCSPTSCGSPPEWARAGRQQRQDDPRRRRRGRDPQARAPAPRRPRLPASSRPTAASSRCAS